MHAELRTGLLEKKATGLGAAGVQSARMLRLRDRLLGLEKAQSSRRELVGEPSFGDSSHH